MNHVKTLKYLANLEGISYLLFAITMPLKYGYNIPGPNRYVGLIHGVLFIAYCLWVLIVGLQDKKKMNFFWIGWVMSLLPFGTFWFDQKFLNTKQTNRS